MAIGYPFPFPILLQLHPFCGNYDAKILIPLPAMQFEIVFGAAGFRVSKRSRLNPVQVSVPQAFSELRGCLGGWERSLTQVLPASSGGSDGFH